jgi:replicative DNA helicase
MLERLPPQNLEAEMAVLGAMLLGDRASIERAGEVLQREDFYRDAHAHIFDAMLHLAESDEPVDPITLNDELRRRDLLETVGGRPYLVQLAEFVPTTANLPYYAKIVAEKATLRRLIGASSQIAGMAYSGENDVEDMVDQAEKVIFDVARRRSKQAFTPLRPLLNEVFDKIDTLYHEKGVVTGVDTGYNDLNYITSGLQGGDLIILAARPSMGKCVKWDNLVINPLNGERITIQEAISLQIPQIAGMGDCGQIRPTSIADWIDSGVKPVWRVTTRLGRSVEVTGHHPFLTIEGWTPLHDIAVGEKIALPRRVPVFGTNDSLPLTLVRLMAYYIAEGGLTGKVPAFTNTDPTIIADFQQIIASHFPDCVIRQRDITYTVVRPTRSEWLRSENPVTLWLKDLQLWGKDATKKTFPDTIWQWPKSHIAEFLRVLMSCDGTIYSLGGYPRIEFAVASEQLARDLHHALTRFGVIAKFWKKKERCWRVEITEVESVEVYQNEIGWLGEKQSRTFETKRQLHRSNVGHLPSRLWQTIRTKATAQGLSFTELARRAGENVPNEGYNPHMRRGVPQKRLFAYANVLNDIELQQLSHPDLYWDEVIAIESIGEHQVYDLTVPDGQNFIAQDILVHNTSLAMGIAQNAALRAGKSVAVFSMEMSKESLVQRMICSEARVDAHRLRTGYLQEEDWTRLANAVQRLWDCSLFIDDSTEMSSLEMRAKCRRLRAEQGIDMIIIDYLQLMRGNSRNTENRNQEISEIARGLKSIARELNVPVIALSQLSRTVERREDKRPMLSDLRESGAIEAEADIVSFIYRPSYYERKQAVTEEDGEKEDNRPAGEYESEEAEIIIAKQRNGPVGTIKLAFIPKFARFDNLAEFSSEF